MMALCMVGHSGYAVDRKNQQQQNQRQRGQLMRKQQQETEENYRADAFSKGDFTVNEAFNELGLSRTATQGEVKKAYHKLALQYHTDKGGS